MTKKEKAVSLILCVALAVSVCIPVKGLLIDGVYSWHVKQPEFWAMVLETGALFLLLSIIWLTVETGKMRLMLTAAVIFLFAWCHVVFLPVVVSGLYVLYMFLTGYTLRRWILRKRGKGFGDFLLGCGAVILLYCFLSVIGAGSIPVLRMTAIVTGLIQAILWLREHKGLPAFPLSVPDKSNIQRLLLVFMVVMVLIQIGRMNISVDFDSLWYGVRSEYMLDNGGGIYENPGTIGLVYTYSKGMEILLLPLSDLVSHSYLICFNVWMAVLTLVAVYGIGRFFMGTSWALLAAACVSSIPGVMNMSITAKTDSMTLLVQLIMVLYFLRYLKEKKAEYILISTGALLLSWTLKPTALVFSTAVYGMIFLYLIGTKQFSLRASWKSWVLPLISLAALTAVWARTWMITGLPVTSVFSSLLSRLGFTMRYPFATISAIGEAGEGSLLSYLARTVYHMLFLPAGEAMSHVAIAWGTSLMFFLPVTCILAVAAGKLKKSKYTLGVHLVLIPFLLVCGISLLMLGQIDGNYFMLLYVFIVLYGCGIISRIKGQKLKLLICLMLIPLLVLNVAMTAVSNWAWSLGCTPVQVLNAGHYPHENIQKETMISLGNEQIWRILEKNPKTRVIAAGNHPQVFDFPCNVQSYDDITSSWGNVVLVKTMDNFVEYLEYAKTDYIYMQAGTVPSDSRCYELMGYLIEAGILTDVLYENGNMLAKVDLQGQPGQEETESYQRYQKEYQPLVTEES